MKKKKTKNNNSTNNIIVAVIAVAMIIALVGGGTYAWWTWTSNVNNATERTNIANSFTISTPTFKITGNNATGTKLAPISSCYDATYSVASNATAVATNNTSSAMRATIILKATLTPTHGTLSDVQKSHINWVLRQSDTSDTTYNTTKCGAAESTTLIKGTFEGYTNNTDFSKTITFDVPAGTTTTKYYQIYVWIDSGYSYQNVGSNAVQDPIQDMKVLVTFSTNSSFAQIQS